MEDPLPTFLAEVQKFLKNALLRFPFRSIHNVWNLFGTGDKARYIPDRSLVQNHGKSKAFQPN